MPEERQTAAPLMAQRAAHGTLRLAPPPVEQPVASLRLQTGAADRAALGRLARPR